MSSKNCVIIDVREKPSGIPELLKSLGLIVNYRMLEVGDYVIVHVGFALSVVDEAEAQRIFETLREMQRLGEAEAGGP